MSTGSRMARAARAYAGYNLRVFPCTPNGKLPLTAHGYQDATADAAQIDAWWSKWPSANVAMACAPSGYMVLDVDSHRLDDAGRAFVADLEANHPTSTQDTPTGGTHYMYMLPHGVALSNSAGQLPAGIDVRVNGYVLLSPSVVTYRGDEAAAKGVADGHTGRYQWRTDMRPNEFPPQPLPDHVLELLLTKRPESPAASIAPPTSDVSSERAFRYAEAALERELDALARAPQGGRNEQLNKSAFSLGQLAAGGALNGHEIADKLSAVSQAIGLDAREIERTIRSGMQAGAKKPRGVPELPRATYAAYTNGNGAQAQTATIDAQAMDLSKLVYKTEDGGILDVWLALYGDGWLFVNGYDTWSRWTGTHWQRDESQEINSEIQTLMQTLNDLAHDRKRAAGDDKAAAAAATAHISATRRSRSRVASIEGMAQANRSARVADLDAGNLLNLQNGTLDLDTLEMTPHDRARAMTYCLPYAYDPQAICPRFRSFVREVLVLEGTTDPDDDLVRLFQELVGYTLTTDTRHEVMVWLAGEGGNGKTVAITILRDLLGGMAGSVDFQTLGATGNYDLADLPGKRLVFSTESKRGGHMAEELLRRIVSGERINTRPIYGSPFNFDPVAKIWWAMNDKPVIRDTSNATWRRLKLIPFNRTFSDAEKDIHLLDKLRDELPGILNWALDGLSRLRAQGAFSPAAAADNAANDYRRESNPIAQWLAECTSKAPENLYPTASSAAYANYKTWCEANGRSALNSTNFGTEIKRTGVTARRTTRGMQLDIALDNA